MEPCEIAYRSATRELNFFIVDLSVLYNGLKCSVVIGYSRSIDYFAQVHSEYGRE